MHENLKIYLAGCIGGTPSLIAYVPVELIKVRAQVNNGANLKYREEIPKILKKEGVRGLYRGFFPLFMREVPTFGVYFLSYHLYQRMLGIDPK